MDGDPAGWYDDPDDSGQKRYWDGSAWTDDRAPAWNSIGSEPSGPYDPLGSDDTPPRKRGSSRRAWLILAIVGVVALVAVVAIVASVTDDESNARFSPTVRVQQVLPSTLEDIYAEQDLTVTITGAACNEITVESGPYTTTCSVGFLGTNRTLVATVIGTVDDDEVTIDEAPTSESVVLDEALAVKGAQGLVDSALPGATVTACKLPATPLVMQDGDKFTCTIADGRTVSFLVTGTKVAVTGVA